VVGPRPGIAVRRRTRVGLAPALCRPALPAAGASGAPRLPAPGRSPRPIRSTRRGGTGVSSPRQGHLPSARSPIPTARRSGWRHASWRSGAASASPSPRSTAPRRHPTRSWAAAQVQPPPLLTEEQRTAQAASETPHPQVRLARDRAMAPRHFPACSRLALRARVWPDQAKGPRWSRPERGAPRWARRVLRQRGLAHKAASPARPGQVPAGGSTRRISPGFRPGCGRRAPGLRWRSAELAGAAAISRPRCGARASSVARHVRGMRPCPAHPGCVPAGEPVWRRALPLTFYFISGG
jgi:hypothetical protein